MAVEETDSDPGMGQPVGERPIDPAQQESPTPRGMLPDRLGRPPLESVFVRVIATGGVVGIGVALGAILVSQSVAGWITGLVVALVSVLLSAILWSSRRL